MKRQIEKHSEGRMKFFTPELYLRYNSPDDAVADRADQEWEEAIRAYREQLKYFLSMMDERVKGLVQGQCLHDAEVLSLEENVADLPLSLPFKTSVTIISLRIDKKIIDIIYLTWAGIRETAAPRGWPFSKLRPHWLYEEIDFEPGPAPIPRFWHRILWSDGRVTSIPFFDVIVHSFSEENPDPATITRRRA